MVFDLEASYIVGYSAWGVLDGKDLLVRWRKANQLRNTAELFLKLIDDDLLSLLRALLCEELGGLVDHSEYFRDEVDSGLICWDYDAFGLVFESVLLEDRHLVLEDSLVVFVKKLFIGEVYADLLH